MAKKYQITQRALINNVKVNTSFAMFADKADVQALCGLLAGGYEVKEIVEDMSNLTKADTNEAASNPVSVISFSGPKGQFASIRPYSGSIHFENTKSVNDITAVLKTITPFELLPTEKPTRISVRRSEYVDNTPSAA
ncbi:MAG: hypothetical protein ACI81I_000818 [Arcobacteraceae bacterium]|jgi:hypothetical protein